MFGKRFYKVRKRTVAGIRGMEFEERDCNHVRKKIKLLYLVELSMTVEQERDTWRFGLTSASKNTGCTHYTCSTNFLIPIFSLVVYTKIHAASLKKYDKISGPRT